MIPPSGPLRGEASTHVTEPSQSASNPPTKRLFIALELPELILEPVGRWIENLKKGMQFTPCRPSWVRPGAIHLTLRFLGDTEAHRIAALSARLTAIAARHAPIRMRVRELGVFPHWRRPRVLWAGVHARGDALGPLHEDIENLAASAGYEPARGEFHPHLTLARFKSGKGIPEAQRVVSGHRDLRTEDATIGEMTLYASELHPGGARHAVLGRFAFSGPPGKNPGCP